MKNFRHLFILLFLAVGWTTLDAQSQFTVDQNFTYRVPGNCFSGRPTIHTGQNPADVATITANTSHDICLTGAPNLAWNIHNQCWRYYRFYVYAETSQQVYLEKVITKYDHWLQGATGPCATGSSNMTLTTQDLINEGITAGKKYIYLKVEYDYYGNTPHYINLNVSDNGFSQCSNPDITSNKGIWGCWLGQVACFNWYPCQVDLNVSAYLELVTFSDGINTYTYVKYNYSANPTGGSGNYSYAWSLSGGPTNTSSTSTFSFYNSQNPTAVNLIVTDNVSGCVYYYNEPLKKSGFEAQAPKPIDWEVAPNPISASSSLRVMFDLPEAGQTDIGLYDMTGKLVWQLADGLDGQMGENTLNLTAPGLAPGIYMLRMNTGSRTMTKKLVVQ